MTREHFSQGHEEEQSNTELVESIERDFAAETRELEERSAQAEILASFHNTLRRIDASKIEFTPPKGAPLQAERVVGNPKFGSELKEGAIPHAISITFPRDFRLNNRNIGMVPDGQEMRANCELYFDLIQKIETFKQRRTGDEKQQKIVTNLEQRRQDLHNRIAGDVSKFYKGYYVTVPPTEARLMAQGLIDIWSLDHFSDDLTYPDEFSQLDLESLKKEIKLRFNIDLSSQRYVHGYHDTEPIYYHNITLSGPMVNTKEANIDALIKKHLSTLPKV